MPDKYNPFRPNGIVAPGMFCGRLDELRTIDHCLLQTKHGNSKHFLIEGERGIGKSSLLLCEQYVATGRIETLNKKKLNFLSLNVSLQETDDLVSIIKRIAGELQARMSERDQLKSIAVATWDIISRLEAGGFRLRENSKEIDQSELLTSLQRDFIKVITSFTDEEEGVLLLIDEADKPPENAHLGLICKLLSEELFRKGCDRLCIGIAGLPNVIQRLRGSHESSPRIFTMITLNPLEDAEREQVIERGLIEASQKNGLEIKITDEAKKFIATLSEGYPHFLQEFAYSAFEMDTDNVIDRSDVASSLFSENGAFDQLGKKYFGQFYATPGSDDYRIVLDVMADSLDEWVDRSTLIQESKLKAGTVDNALRALKNRNVILQNDMRRGQYRLPTRSFGVWINAKKIANKAAIESDPTLFDKTSV
jgi:hypothetical protein